MPTLQFKIPGRSSFDEKNRLAVTSVDGSFDAMVSFDHAGGTIRIPQFGSSGRMKDIVSEMPTVFTFAAAGYINVVVTAKFGDTVEVTMTPRVKVPEVKIPKVAIPT